jgi:TatD DNase family protein
MIDSHCHLTDPRLRSQLPEVLIRAKAAGVDYIVTIGTEPKDWSAVIDLSIQDVVGVGQKQGDKRALLRCAIGIHPNNSADATVEDLKPLRMAKGWPCVVALGEMGLDYHWKDVPSAKQRMIFEAQLQIAAELQYPVIIHSREAIDDTLAVLAQFPTVRAVFHCFTGTLAEAERILAAGYLLGFTGPITYKNAGHLVDVVKLTPLDRLLVETDGPYLSPEPMRKIKTNEPAFVAHTLAKVAAVKGISLEAADAATTANTLKFYRWE